MSFTGWYNVVPLDRRTVWVILCGSFELEVGLARGMN